MIMDYEKSLYPSTLGMNLRLLSGTSQHCLIASEDVLRQVFTHRSVYGRPGHQFEDTPDDPSPDNESLEHLGDSIVGFIVTNLIQKMYPNIHVGPATKIRSKMVENTTLAALAVHYKMPDLLIAHPAQLFVLRGSRNIQGDLFEAYIAGVYITQGLEATTEWLYALFKPLIANEYDCIRLDYYGFNTGQQSETDSTDTTDSNSSSSEHLSSTFAPRSRSTTAGYLMLFNEYLVKNKLSADWIWDSDSNTNGKAACPWTVQIMMHDTCVGSGKSNTKQGAKNGAALRALQSLGVLGV